MAGPLNPLEVTVTVTGLNPLQVAVPDLTGVIPPPLIIDNEAACLTGASNAASVNIVYLYAFELLLPVSIVSMRYRCTATALGNTNTGIYTFAGNVVADTGPQANTANTTKTIVYGSPIALVAGRYFLALACDAADTFQAISPTVTDASRAKRATNVLAAGALPLTTGVIVANTSFVPCMAALVSGGLT